MAIRTFIRAKFDRYSDGLRRQTRCAGCRIVDIESIGRSNALESRLAATMLTRILHLV